MGLGFWLEFTQDKEMSKTLMNIKDLRAVTVIGVAGPFHFQFFGTLDHY